MPRRAAFGDQPVHRPTGGLRCPTLRPRIAPTPTGESSRGPLRSVPRSPPAPGPFAPTPPRSPARDRGSATSASVVAGPVRCAARGDGVVEDLILVGGTGDAVLAGRAAVLFPGAQQELISPAAVAGSPGVAAALFGVTDADPKR